MHYKYHVSADILVTCFIHVTSLKKLLKLCNTYNCYQKASTLLNRHLLSSHSQSTNSQCNMCNSLKVPYLELRSLVLCVYKCCYISNPYVSYNFGNSISMNFKEHLMQYPNKIYLKNIKKEDILYIKVQPCFDNFLLFCIIITYTVFSFTFRQNFTYNHYDPRNFFQANYNLLFYFLPSVVISHKPYTSPIFYLFNLNYLNVNGR